MLGARWLANSCEGVLLGVPITVTLVGGDLSAGPEVGAPVDMSLRVRFEKE
jgi:hypothetical protein